MKRNRRILMALGCVLCVCLAASAPGGAMADEPVPLLQGLAYEAETLAEQLTVSTEADSCVVDAALEAILAHPDVIRPGDAEGIFDFPQLEMQQTGLGVKTVRLESEDLWVVSFIPEGVPHMAACAAVSGQGQVLDVFAGSGWLMQHSWEKLLGRPGWMWPVKARYAFHLLFEPEEMWSHAALPGTDAISEEAALEIAKKAAGVDAGYGIATEYRYTRQYDSAGCGVWTVQFYQQGESGPAVAYSLDIHSETGEVLDIRATGDGLG